MPLAAPPPPPSTPPVDLLDLLPPIDQIPPPPAPPAPVAHPSPSNLAARIGLVLALVVALAGVVSAVAKAGDDGRRTTTASSSSAHDADQADRAGGPDQGEDIDDPLAAIAPAEVPPGFEVRQGKGLSLAVPADWRSLDGGDLQELLDSGAIDEAMPDLDRSGRDAMQDAVDRGALFMAIDVSAEGGGRNINAIRVLGEAPLRRLYEQVIAELQNAGMPVEPVGSRHVDTPLGDSLRIEMRETIGGRTFPIVQYYVPFDGHTFIVTGTGVDDIVDRAIQTLRVSDAV